MATAAPARWPAPNRELLLDGADLLLPVEHPLGEGLAARSSSAAFCGVALPRLVIGESQRLTSRTVGAFVLGAQTIQLLLQLLLVGHDDGRPFREPRVIGRLGHRLGQLDLGIGPFGLGVSALAPR